MSELRKIALKDVRIGDVVRQEPKPELSARSAVVAVETRVVEPGFLSYDDGNADTYLISRPLPNVPYTVIAPPDSSRDVWSPYVLDYDGGSNLRWFRRGTAQEPEAVMDALVSGWTIIEMKGTDDE